MDELTMSKCVLCLILLAIFIVIDLIARKVINDKLKHNRLIFWWSVVLAMFLSAYSLITFAFYERRLLYVALVLVSVMTVKITRKGYVIVEEQLLQELAESVEVNNND